MNAAPADEVPPALEARGLQMSFGALRVAADIDFALARGGRQALIGPNGAGKTTLVNLLTGELTPSAGQIRLDGHDITALPPHARVRLGLARTFQINQLFAGLPVIDNVALALAERQSAARNLWHPLGTHRELLDEAFALLETMGLADEALAPVHALPYGRQRLLEIAVALATRPKVLLLDEPAAGVPQAERQLILDAVDALGENIAILIIEHDMDVVFRFAERITVLVGGAVLTEGTPEEIAANEEVRAIYLGEAERF